MTTALRLERSQSFLPVRTVAVSVSTDFRLSLYLRNDQSQEYQLYCSSGAALDTSDLARLHDAGIATVYLDRSEYRRFQDHLRASLPAVIRDETLPVPLRLGMLNEVVRGVLMETFHWGNVERAAQETGKFADYVVDLIGNEDFVASELKSVLHFDHGTFTHSANVGVYSVLLAKSLGHYDRETLVRIGRGALLHDIGKLGVPQDLIQKKGPLTPAEREMMRRHAGLGLINLKHIDDIDFGQLMMVYQHHERLDGTGYPVQLQGDEIHEWARICAVADVFEALTSHRPYRRPLTTDDALELMCQSSGEGLDPEMLRCWTMTISRS